MRQTTWIAVVLVLAAPAVAAAQWQTHEVRHLNGRAAAFRLPAKLQIVTEKWNRVVAVPYIVYMPEKDRLLMLVGVRLSALCVRPDQRRSRGHVDRAAAGRRRRPGQGVRAMGTSLAYLGGGRAMLYAGSGGIGGGPARWFTQDFGQTWGNPVPIAPTPEGKPWYTWDPPLVERDATTGKVTRLVETGYTWWKPPEVTFGHQQGYLRLSTDEGKTWSEAVKVPEWQAVSEVALLRAANGDLVAACRTDMPRRMEGDIDHAEGLGVSISKDNGRTWSAVERLYEWGRHHPAMILMPERRHRHDLRRPPGLHRRQGRLPAVRHRSDHEPRPRPDLGPRPPLHPALVDGQTQGRRHLIGGPAARPRPRSLFCRTGRFSRPSAPATASTRATYRRALGTSA